MQKRQKPNAIRWSVLACALLLANAHAQDFDDGYSSGYTAGNVAPIQKISELTYPQALLFTLKNSPNVQRYQLLAAGGQAQLDASKNLRMPQISVSASSGKASGDSTHKSIPETTYGLNIFQTLYDFGKTKGQIDEAIYLSEQKQADYLDAMNQAAYKTSQAYLDILRFQDLLKATIEGKQNIEHIRNMSKLRADAGLSSTSDYQQADIRIQNINATLANYNAQFRSAEKKLTIETNVKADSYQPIPDEYFQHEIKPVSVFDQVPSVLSAEANKGITSARLNQIKADRFATLGLQMGYQNNRFSTSGYNNYDTQNVQLVVRNTPIQGNYTGNRIKAAESERAAAQQQVDAVRFDLNQQIAAIEQDLNAAKVRELAFKAQYEQAIRTSDTFQEEYKLGKRSLFELLNIAQQILDANVSRISSIYDQQSYHIQYNVLTNQIRPSNQSASIAVGEEK